MLVLAEWHFCHHNTRSACTVVPSSTSYHPRFLIFRQSGTDNVRRVSLCACLFQSSAVACLILTRLAIAESTLSSRRRYGFSCNCRIIRLARGTVTCRCRQRAIWHWTLIHPGLDFLIVTKKGVQRVHLNGSQCRQTQMDDAQRIIA